MILFPGAKAISANEFPWNGGVTTIPTNENRNITTTTAIETEASANGDAIKSTATTTTAKTTTANNPSISSPSSSSSPSSPRWRLVVLESNWINGKTIFNQLNKYREIKQLLPLRTVILHDLQGQYWRFHEEGWFYVWFI